MTDKSFFNLVLFTLPGLVISDANANYGSSEEWIFASTVFGTFIGVVFYIICLFLDFLIWRFLAFRVGFFAPAVIFFPFISWKLSPEGWGVGVDFYIGATLGLVFATFFYVFLYKKYLSLDKS